MGFNSFDSLVHQIAWTPAALSETPLRFQKVVFLASDREKNINLSSYMQQVADEGLESAIICEISELGPSLIPGTIIVQIPDLARVRDGVYDAATRSCANLVAAAQMLLKLSKIKGQASMNTACKLFSIISLDSSVNDLGFAPLRGLARVLQMEIPEIFGGLFEESRKCFPFSAIRYARGYDVVRIFEGVAQTGSLQSLVKQPNQKALIFSSDGTYLITGGTRGVGLEVATWMCERGARNLLLVSRRGLSSYHGPENADQHSDFERLISRIAQLEAQGVRIEVLGIDVAQPRADSALGQAIKDLKMPTVKGVFHGAGISGYHTLQRCTASDIGEVLSPKVVGALNITALFPPGQLDFLFLASSIGQLIGFPGQLAYAAANSFLDELALHRRSQGDRCTSVQWGGWRDVGLMAQSKSVTRMLNKGMQAAGIATVTKEEAFKAWEQIAHLDTGNVAVVRVLEPEPGELPRHPMLKNFIARPQQERNTDFSKYPEHAVAVVGMACRTAAGDTLEDFWEVIEEGRSMAREMDAKRFPDVPQGRLWGNFLSDIDSFDHQFFKKSKREASALDPHQRLLLQTTYHALESAGCFGYGKQQKPESYDKEKNEDTTGCFIGMNAPDYPLNLSCHPPSPYTALGMLRSFVSGRLSHHFGWTGPSHVIDTACSSAMVAIHQACQAIQAGECTRAVAGGVNLITNTALSEALRAGGFTNQTGGCKTFDASADGYCRGEAVGVVVLKSLAKALKDGDDIQGVLLATANNQNVNYTSITNPVLESQVALYKEVLARAGISPKDISYVEAHGTGTRSGDPVEVSAIRQALGGVKERSHPLHIGAVKPNVGHAEGASGVVSLIKVLLMLKHGKIPPQAGFRNLNPNIAPLEPDGLAISKSLHAWDDKWRLALVNNAGASGNNAFAVLAPAPVCQHISNSAVESAAPDLVKAAWPIFISAASKESLLAYCATFMDRIRNGRFAYQPLSHVSYALATKQNRQLQHTFCTTATSIDNLQTQLSELERHITASPNPKPIVLMFSGQNGNIVPGAKLMYSGSLLFRKYLHKCEEVMQSLGLPSLLTAALEGIQGDADLVIRHAAMIAIQYSCGMAWIDSGIIPQAVCGHSLGEWTAMAISGAIPLEECMRLVTGLKLGRAELIQKLWGADKGAMIAIDTDLLAADMTPTRHLSFFREEYPETKLDISCYNGPNNYVVAGATADIETLESYLKSSKANGERIRYKVMRGMHAYHCALVDSILSHSAELCAPVDYRETTFAFETCHEGPWDIPGGDIIARNTRGAVYFTQAISRIVNRLGSCTFLEAGIGGPIISMARNALLQSQSQHIFISIGAKDPVQSLADATVSLWKAGQSDLQFWPFHREERSGYVPTALPSYQFEKNGHWIEYTGIPNHTENRNVQPPQQSQQPRTCPHCLKDTSDFSYISRDDSKGQSGNQYNFTIDIRSRRYQDLVKGHAVVGSPICPAGMYLELASHAITLLPDAVYISAPWEIVSQGLDIKAPLGLDAKRAVTLSLTNQAKNLWEFELSSTRNQSTQTSHATGVICLQQGNRRNSSEGGSDRAKWDRISNLLDEDEDTESLRGTMVYKVFGKMAKYSPPYKGIKYLVGKGVEGAGDIKMPGQDLDAIAKSPNSKIADPLLMDNFLQVAGAFVHSLRESERELDDEISCVCTGMGLVGPLSELHGSGVYRVYTKILQEDKKQILLDVFAFDKKTKLMIWSAKGLKFARIPRNLLSRIVAVASPEWNLEEQAIKLPKPIAPGALPVPEPSQQTTFPVTSEDTSKNYTSIDVFSDVQDILSESLNVDIQEIIMEAWMEDLGANPLIGSEILALVTTKYDIDIATDAFAMVTTVKSLCELISDHLSIGAAQIKKDEDIGDKKPDLSVEVANQTPPDWQKTIFEILSRSLELNIVEIKMESKMEDLGADSLVAAEIVSHLNDAFKLSASPTDFATVEDVKSLCDFISTALGIAPLKRRISSSASDSSETPYSTLITSETKDLELVSPTSDEKQASIQDNARSLWESFRRIRRRFDHHAIENKLAGFWDHVYPQQLSAVASFIVEAFEKLGCPIKTFTQGEKLPELQNTLPRWHREVPRLWEILEEAGIVERAGESFVRGSARIQNDGDNLTVRLISDFPQYTSSHGLFQLIGPHLADCLTGKIDPVSILFGSKMGRNLLADYYANAPDLNTATKVLCEFFSAAIQDRSPNPDHEPFRILEIGAGTGGTTKHLVPVLQATGLPFTYTFTDISASLLTHAKRTTFKGIAGVEFRKLNIEEDPSEDLLGRYHIVLSTNCIHATHKLRGSLANIRKLVRPDGCVALVEVGQKRAWYELVWGLLDGWWFFNDDRTYPLQSPWEWERAMHDTGFADVDWSESASRESRDVRVICGMANEVKNSFSTKATSMLLHRGSTSADRNLFLIPDGFGSGAVFGALTPLLQRITDLSVYALNSPFLRNIPNLESQTSLEELAGIYVTEIKRRQPRGPYLIGGYSIGGVIAYEAVRQLLEAQNEVEKLFLFDTICPTLGNCLPDNLAEFLDSIRTIGMTNGNAIRRLIMSDHFAFSRQLLMRYQVSKLPGKKTPPVVLVSAKEGVDKQDEIPRPKVRPEEQNIADWFLDDRTGDESFGWNGLLGSGNVSVIRADGSHFSLMLSSKIHGWGSNFVDLLV